KKWYCGNDGWRTAAEISAKGYKKYVYGNKAKVSKTTTVNKDTVTFYAEWKKSNSYTIKYNANGGSGSMSDQTITYGVSTATRANAFTKSGYTFAGWT
ncbi:MAG: InlB B-repeat-containing protein, partial [Butyrivibrio sp.]|nr:InlB B-repeat-containing protein [Butyrivibrio sp.]